MLDLASMPNAAALEALPVFPLPNVVFLPGMILPLNVFEPRYLQLVEQAIAQDTAYIGVPLLLSDARLSAEEKAHEGDGAPFEKVFGLGKLVFHQKLSEELHFIRLECLGRVRALSEIPAPASQGYRRLKVELLPEQYPSDPHMLNVLQSQVERMAETFSESEREMVRSVLAIRDKRIVIYALSALIPNVEALQGAPPNEEIAEDAHQLRLQQRCLAAPSPDARIDLLLERTVILVKQMIAKGSFPRRMMN